MGSDGLAAEETGMPTDRRSLFLQRLPPAAIEAIRVANEGLPQPALVGPDLSMLVQKGRQRVTDFLKLLQGAACLRVTAAAADATEGLWGCGCNLRVRGRDSVPG